ncbi:MAG: DUF1152 domain-containing protein [Polyangiaceae bacterium]|nr:DUF1152 domain-containing protein [Polyangiaceae bacterium]
MSLDRSPFFERLDGAKSVLIAGAGGGFDVFAGLPVYFHLERLGKKVHLANLSFTNLVKAEGRRLNAHAIEITAASQGPEYFPEGQLARWFERRSQQVPVYALEKTGGRPLRLAYERLQQELGFDTIVLVDGGTDILMRGDEAGLGTPQEDITSLAVVNSLAIEQKFVLCVGFGVDRFHGVCHAHFLENVAALSRENAFLGVISLLPEHPEAALYREAVSYACEQTKNKPSIVCLSIKSAIEGSYGDVHSTERTEGSRLWINPLMSMYWAFELGAVARRCFYLDAVLGTETAWEATAMIEAVRKTLKCRAWEDIPV